MFALARRSNGQPQSARAEQMPSVLGPGFKASGVFEIEGELVVHGTISGRIHALKLFVAADGFVEADVVAKEVRIAGCFVGRVFAPTVTVEETAEIRGRLFHTDITVARGARIDGRTPWRPANYFETLDHLPETNA